VRVHHRLGVVHGVLYPLLNASVIVRLTTHNVSLKHSTRGQSNMAKAEENALRTLRAPDCPASAIPEIRAAPKFEIGHVTPHLTYRCTFLVRRRNAVQYMHRKFQMFSFNCSRDRKGVSKVICGSRYPARPPVTYPCIF